MKKLTVEIEINGKSVYVGDIIGNDYKDACFTYAEDYLSSATAKAISISLPLTTKTYTIIKLLNFVYYIEWLT